MAKRSETKPPCQQPLFDSQSTAYQTWRDNRLSLQEQRLNNGYQIIELSSTIKNTADHNALDAICRGVLHHGFALYQWTDFPDNVQTSVARLNAALGLTQHDEGVVQNNNGLSLLKDLANTPKGRFIPYTSRAMGWHTDGYYNDPSALLRSFSLHCISPAAVGGSLFLMDYELLLIAIHEDEPELLSELTHPQSMTLPANKDTLGHNRPDRKVPVWFSGPDQQPGLRFTTRTQNISWRTPDTQAAAERMAVLIDTSSHWHYSVRLESGQGVITRNILHRREAFEDSAQGPPREILRGRYLDSPRYDSDYRG